MRLIALATQNKMICSKRRMRRMNKSAQLAQLAQLADIYTNPNLDQ